MDWWSIGFGTAGFISGAAGLAIAIRANGIAKKANSIAEDSNVKAAEANLIAQQSNDLAKDANTISGRALDLSAEVVDYFWRVEIDDDAAAIVVFNDSSVSAVNVSVFARQKDETVASGRVEKVAPFGQLTFDFQRALDEHFLHVKNSTISVMGMFQDGTIGKLGSRHPHTSRYVVHVAWETPSGQQRTTKLEVELAHFESFEEGRPIKRVIH